MVVKSYLDIAGLPSEANKKPPLVHLDSMPKYRLFLMN